MAQQYSRVFITLTQDRSGYGLKSRAPAGRAIIEVNAGHGKITVTVQDLKCEVIYKAYIVSSARDCRAVLLGSLSADERGKGELRWEFDPSNVENTGIPIHEFDVVTVAVLSKADRAWVLTGYRNGDVNFKNKFNDVKAGLAADARVIEQPAPYAAPPAEAAVAEPLPEPVAEPLPEPVVEAAEAEPLPEPVVEAAEAEPLPEPVVEAAEAEPLPEPVTEAAEAEPSNTYPSPESADIPEDFPGLKHFDISGDFSKPEPEPSGDIHRSFRDMARRFNKELEELDNLVFTKDSFKTGLDLVMDNNAAMSPFRAPGPGLEQVNWVRISLKELALLPNDCWRLMYEPFVVLACGKYRHMMLGEDAADGKKYILALPGVREPGMETYVNNLGFGAFKPCDNVAREYRDSNYGYWLMDLQK